MRITCFLLIASLTTLSSCYFLDRRIEGNGNFIAETREVSSFSRIEVHGAMDVEVTPGTSQVRVEADANLQEYIETYVKGDRLIIREKDGVNLRSSKDIKVHVTAPTLSGIDVSGASKVNGNGLFTHNGMVKLDVSGAGSIKVNVNATSINADISGSGDILVGGNARDLDLEISGAGMAKCFDLQTENVRVDISGAGGANVSVSKSIDADVSGAGTVKYRGNPSVTKDVSGAGSVSRVD